MAVRFTRQDLQIFEIPDFQDRMTAIREQIRPKLVVLGEALGPLLMNQFKREFFPHVAKHLRRSVYPADETWLALGPQAKGYKAYVHFLFSIGKKGTQARVAMRTEAALRPELGKNLLTNRNFFKRREADFKGLCDYSRRNDQFVPKKIEEIGVFLQEAADRLAKVKSAVFDVGFDLKPLSPNLPQDILKAFDLLFPFYECGLDLEVRFS